MKIRSDDKLKTNGKIKFRVWDKELKEMNYLSLQDLCENDYWYDGKTSIWSVLCDCYNENERFEIMQYTNLKDKNGVEIYEGDIIETCENYGIGEVWLKYEVKYNEQFAQFVLFPIIENGKYNSNNWDVLINYYHEQAREVIGNIYDELKGGDVNEKRRV